jgi:hypothetical protein
VYFFVSRKLTLLRTAPLLAATVYGLLVYLIMNFVVLPLSASGAPTFTLRGVLNQLFAHVFCIGIPAALFARWARMRASWRAGTVEGETL